MRRWIEFGGSSNWFQDPEWRYDHGEPDDTRFVSMPYKLTLFNFLNQLGMGAEIPGRKGYRVTYLYDTGSATPDPTPGCPAPHVPSPFDFATGPLPLISPDLYTMLLSGFPVFNGVVFQNYYTPQIFDFSFFEPPSKNG